jgi:hypothetical protein
LTLTAEGISPLIPFIPAGILEAVKKIGVALLSFLLFLVPTIPGACACQGCGQEEEQVSTSCCGSQDSDREVATFAGCCASDGWEMSTPGCCQTPPDPPLQSCCGGTACHCAQAGMECNCHGQKKSSQAPLPVRSETNRGAEMQTLVAILPLCLNPPTGGLPGSMRTLQGDFTSPCNLPLYLSFNSLLC